MLRAPVRLAHCARSVWWQEQQHTLRASLPTVQTTLERVNGSKMAREWLRGGLLASKRCRREKSAHQKLHPHSSAAAVTCCPPPITRGGRSWCIDRGGMRKWRRNGGAHQLACSLTPCQSSSSARRVQLGRPRVPRTVMALGNAVAHNDGGVKRRCAPIRLQQQQRMLCWCARSISRRALCVAPVLTQHQHRRRAFESARGWRRYVCAALCSAPATPGRRRRAQLGRARRAQRRQTFTGHAATRGRWWLRRARRQVSKRQSCAASSCFAGGV